MTRILFCLTILFLSLPVDKISAQADNTLWASLRLRITPDDKSTIDIRPISRFHENYSDYRNTSVDYSYSRKVSKLFTLGIIGRTWFLKDGSNRQFVWPFVSVGVKSGKSSFQTRFMKHWAIDLKDVADRDFFRIKPAMNYPLSDKVSSQIAIEPWYQFDDENSFTRIRYELSLGYKITDHMSASVVYRRENDKISPDFDMMVTTLTYKL